MIAMLEQYTCIKLCWNITDIPLSPPEQLQMVHNTSYLSNETFDRLAKFYFHVQKSCFSIKTVNFVIHCVSKFCMLIKCVLHDHCTKLWHGRWIIEKLLALVQLTHGSFNPGLPYIYLFFVAWRTGWGLFQLLRLRSLYKEGLED